MTSFDNININIPDNWHDETTITLCAERNGSFTPNILIGKTKLEAGTTLPELASFTGDHLAATLGDASLVILAEALIQLDGKEAYQRIYQFKLDPSGSAIVQQIQIHQIRGDIAIAITFTDLVDNFGASMPQAMKTILESFQWGEDDQKSGEHDGHHHH